MLFYFRTLVEQPTVLPLKDCGRTLTILVMSELLQIKLGMVCLKKLLIKKLDQNGMMATYLSCLVNDYRVILVLVKFIPAQLTIKLVNLSVVQHLKLMV